MWNTIIITPLATLLHFFFLFTGDIGLAIICFTVFVKVLLFPLNISSAKTSKGMKLVQGQVDKLREKHKGSPQVLGAELSKLYKENNIKPFAGILNLFIQLPILLGLYQIVIKELKILTDTTTFFALEIAKPSIFLAILAFASMYVLMHFSTKDLAPAADMKDGFQKDFAKMMAIQMKYFMPILILVTSTFLPAGIVIYIITANVFGIFQTLLIKKITDKHFAKSA